MRLLAVHADEFAFEATMPEESVGDADEQPEPNSRSGEFQECVVAFAAVERGDEPTDALVRSAAAECREVLDDLRAERLALVPRAGVTDDPADAAVTGELLRGVAAELDCEVLRAPAGWHLAYDLSARGHPYAEQVREVAPDDPAAGEWFVVRDGERRPFAVASEPLPSDCRALADRIAAGGDGHPPAAARDLLAETGLAAWDGGDRRWLPRGVSVRTSLRASATDLALGAGAVPVEPAERSPPPTEFRTASPRRYDSGGGDAPPTMRAAVADEERTRAELADGVALVQRAGDALGVEHLPVVRATGAFDAWLSDLAERFDPILLQRLPDARGDRFAVEFVPREARWPGERPGVELRRTSVGADGENHEAGQRTLRCAPFGSLAGAVVALLDRAAALAPPRLPTWLAPTQVRLVPVADDHASRCDDLAERLADAGVRADVDARETTVGERLARADADWVPYVACVGARELDRERAAQGRATLPVTARADRQERETTVEQLAETVLASVGDRPNVRRYVPGRVGDSPRSQFE